MTGPRRAQPAEEPGYPPERDPTTEPWPAERAPAPLRAAPTDRETRAPAPSPSGILKAAEEAALAEDGDAETVGRWLESAAPAPTPEPFPGFQAAMEWLRTPPDPAQLQLQNRLAGLSPSRLVALTVDAVARAYRMALPNVAPQMERAAEVLNRFPGLEIEVEPTLLRVDGEPALKPDANRGHWIAGAYLAGLRSLRLRAGLRSEQVSALARALAAIGSDTASIQRFYAWLWAGGADGFDVVQETRAAVAFPLPEAPTDSPFLSAPPAPPAGFAPHGTGIRPSPGQRCVEDFWDAPYVPLPRRERELLRELVENPDGWTAAEAETAVQDATVRGTLTPRKVASLLLAALARSTGSDDLRLCIDLLRDTSDPELASELRGRGLGRVLGRALLVLDRPTVLALRELFPLLPEDARRALLLGLLERGPGHARLGDGLILLFEGLGIERAFRLLPLGKLSEPAAVMLVRTLSRFHVPEALQGGTAASRDAEPRFSYWSAVAPRARKARLERLRELLRAVAPASTLRLLREVPEAALRDFQEIVQELLDHPERGLHAALVAFLLQPGLNERDQWGIWLLYGCVESGRAADWPSRPLYRALEGCLRGGLGKNLAFLAGSRKHAPPLRAAALDVLGERPALLRMAVDGARADFLEPRVVRERLQAARRRLEGR